MKLLFKFKLDPFFKTCASSCYFGTYRGPGSSIVSSVCNVQCDTNALKCQTMTSTEVIALNKNLTCLPGFDRVGYNCIERSKSLKSNIIYTNSCLFNNYLSFQF